MRVYMQLQAARRWNKQEWRPRAKSGGSTGVCVSVQVLGGGDGKLQSRSCVGFGTTEAGGCCVRAPDGRGRLRLGSQAASCWQGLRQFFSTSSKFIEIYTNITTLDLFRQFVLEIYTIKIYLLACQN